MSIETVWLVATVADWVDLVVHQLPLTAAVWITMVGGCIGSFMNVVIYRLPAGMSLVHPASHCPRCGQPIRVRDNLPVIGWLMLRGRCRDCRNVISARYPLVEAAVAVIFLALWLIDVVWPAELLTTPIRLGVFGLDVLLICTLICIALIEVDGQRVPWRLIFPAVIALLLALGLAPQLIDPLQRHPFELPPWGGMAIGALLGGVLGGLSVGLGRRQGPRRSPLMVAALTGGYLSWMAVSLIASVTAALFLLLRRLRSYSDTARWSLMFTLVTLLFLICDSLVFPTPPRETLASRLVISLVAIALTVMAGQLGRD